jgi:hypothetical protein
LATLIYVDLRRYLLPTVKQRTLKFLRNVTSKSTRTTLASPGESRVDLQQVICSLYVHAYMSEVSVHNKHDVVTIF